MLGLNALHKSLLRMEPEAAHEAAIRALRLVQLTRFPLGLLRRRCDVQDGRLEQRIWDAHFPNPIGLAAGFDKNGQAISGLAALGFGFLEVGTVTPMPQRGNPRPRVFRHPAQQSLQNALGFNNDGAEAIKRRLRKQMPYPVPVGLNIGKNRSTPPDAAVLDYQKLADGLKGLADYFVINISSPNTPGLRDLQQRQTVVELVSQCRKRTSKQLLIKLAPDLRDDEAVELAGSALGAGADGLVITNTTTDYSLVPGARQIGGLSGGVLRRRSYEMLRLLAVELGRTTTLISVGGIDSSAEVYTRLKAGASLVEIYTAMVYQGPLLAGRLVRGLLELLERDGVDTIGEVIGADI